MSSSSSEQSNAVQAGATTRRSRRDKARSELRLLLRDGPVKYVRLLYRLRRFHRAVDRMRDEDRCS